METLFFDLGITLILYLQTLGEGLAAVMQFFTFLGTENFFLFVAPVIYWCVNSSLGLRLGLFLMLSNVLNHWAKIIFHDPRPYWYDGRVKALAVEDSFGVPSGHAQHAVVVWGGIAANYRRPWLWVILLATMFLIGSSRLVLGMHFPTDVLVGWILGAGLLVGLIRLEPPVQAWLGKLTLVQQVLASFAFSLVLILIGVLIRLSLSAWTVPAAWVEAAARALPEADPINPLSLKGLVSNAGTFFGLALGGSLAIRRGGFDAGGPLIQRVGRFLIGLLGVVILWYGLGQVFPGGETFIPFTLRYVRYCLVGLWITWLAPLVFLQLGLGRFNQDFSVPHVGHAVGTYSDR